MSMNAHLIIGIPAGFSSRGVGVVQNGHGDVAKDGIEGPAMLAFFVQPEQGFQQDGLAVHAQDVTRPGDGPGCAAKFKFVHRETFLVYNRLTARR